MVTGFGTPIKALMRSIEWCHFSDLKMTPNPDFKGTALRDVETANFQLHGASRGLSRQLSFLFPRPARILGGAYRPILVYVAWYDIYVLNVQNTIYTKTRTRA